MNFFTTIATIALVTFICLMSLTEAGGDKSAKTTVITLAGGGDKSAGHPIPIPVPFCAGKMHYGHHGHHGGGGGGYSHGGYGAQARMGWRR